MLDRHALTIARSELERRFLALVRRAGLPMPLTQQRVNGCTVDFYWPHAGLVVETDGLRYHRTAAKQAVDRRRDQKHAIAGIRELRFTNAQVVREPAWVTKVLHAMLG